MNFTLDFLSVQSDHISELGEPEKPAADVRRNSVQRKFTARSRFLDSVGLHVYRDALVDVDKVDKIEDFAKVYKLILSSAWLWFLIFVCFVYLSGDESHFELRGDGRARTRYVLPSCPERQSTRQDDGDDKIL